MSNVYLVNIGANTAHSSQARSPLFDDGTFTFVSFPHPNKPGIRPYPVEAQPFVKKKFINQTHSDPDWKNLTYGDDCRNRRAIALKKVVEDDVLLFWGLLWRNTGKEWKTFTSERRWCLIGALRVREILKPGQLPTDAKSTRVKRAQQNVHFHREELEPGNFVFIGCTRYSRLFPVAVDLEVTNQSGLLYRTVRTGSGNPLTLNGKPKWSNSLRSCRRIWDLSDHNSKRLAQIASKRISEVTGYDLLADL